LSHFICLAFLESLGASHVREDFFFFFFFSLSHVSLVGYESLGGTGHSRRRGAHGRIGHGYNFPSEHGGGNFIQLSYKEGASPRLWVLLFLFFNLFI